MPLQALLVAASLLADASAPMQPAATPAAQPAPPAAARGTVVSELPRQSWCMMHAANGDYWFGSEDRGVYRYDGTTIVNYSTADGLSGNRVRGIQQDKAGSIYFTTPAGVCKFDGSAFTTLTAVDPPDRDNAGGWRLHPDDLWFTWGKGVCRYDGTTLWDLKLPVSPVEAEMQDLFRGARSDPYSVFSIYRDSRGHMWIGTGNLGVCRYDGRSFGWLYEDHLIYVPNGGMFGLRSVIEDKDGAYWICNTRHRFRVQPEVVDGRIVYTREPGIDPATTDGERVYFQGAVADADGNLWLSPYGGGVWKWDGADATNHPVRENGQDLQVITIFKDNDDRPWLATETAGPYRLDAGTFQPFRP